MQHYKKGFIVSASREPVPALLNFANIRMGLPDGLRLGCWKDLPPPPPGVLSSPYRHYNALPPCFAVAAPAGAFLRVIVQIHHADANRLTGASGGCGRALCENLSKPSFLHIRIPARGLGGVREEHNRDACYACALLVSFNLNAWRWLSP